MYSVLNQKAQEKLIYAFAQYNHIPSPDQLNAVLAIQSTLTLMLSGMAAPKYYLSALDPGMGKTTAILCWLDALLEQPEVYDNQGILIALDRLEEIERYIKDGSIPEDRYAVLVSDGNELNDEGLGAHARDKALILYTTKAQIRNRCRGGNFNGIQAFHFNGRPRKVKVWDESFSIGKEVILNPYDFGKPLATLNRVSAELSDAVLNIFQELKEHKTGDTYQMPSLPPLPKELEQEKLWGSSEERELAGMLWELSGQPVTVHMNKNRQILVDCVPSIPDDFTPCLILDASARVKPTYNFQQAARNDIICLSDSKKSYRNLDVMVWGRSSGKQIIKDMPVVLPELVALITARQGERFLIVLHKDHRESIYKALSKQLSPAELDKVALCTWNRHTATNEFSEIANIIMLSPFQFPDYAYEALTRAATGMTTADGKPLTEHIQQVKQGEILSNILQAVNRGVVRKSEGDTCPPCRLWIITHPNTGIANELTNIFPGCRVLNWKLTKPQLTSSKQRQVFEHIQSLITQGFTSVLAATVRDYLEIKGTPNNFTRDVLTKETFMDALAGIGWERVKISGEYSFRDQKVLQSA